MRWPMKVTPGAVNGSIMSVMDVMPTLLEAAGVSPDTEFPIDGESMLTTIIQQQHRPREELLFFISETPFKNHINVTAFNDEWKLVQQIHSGLSSVDIDNFLFNVTEDP